MTSIMSVSGTFTSSSDGMSIFYREWSLKDPRGILLILHGMSEHSGRYEEVGSLLADILNFKVVALDHRGHGRTACPNDGEYMELGKFHTRKDLSSLNCLEVMATDGLDLIRSIYGTNGNHDIPLFIFGHSMGTVIARWAMKIMPANIEARLHGVILSGVPTVPAIYERIPLMIVLKTALLLRTGQDALHRFVMGQFDDAIRKLRKDNSLPRDCMISSVRSEIDDFHRDPRCGQSIDLLIWDSLRMSLINLQKPETFFKNSSQRRYPLLFIAGKDDPICAFGKTSVADAKKMRTLGFHVDEVLLDCCQHEFTKETKEVKDLGLEKTLSWIRSKL